MSKGKILALLTSILALAAVAATSKTFLDDALVTTFGPTDQIPIILDPSGTPLNKRVAASTVFTSTRTNSTFKGSTTVDALTTATLTNSGDYFGVAATLTGDLTLSGGTASRFVALSAGKAAAYSAASSVLAATITDETGSGALVFGTSPTLATPTVDSMTFSGATASRILALDGAKSTVSTITSANLAASISDETGSGLAVFSGSPTVTNLAVKGSFGFGQVTNDTTDSATNHLVSFTAGSQAFITATNNVHVIPTNTAAGLRLTVLIDANGSARTVSVPATIRSLGLTNGQATLPSGSIGRLEVIGYGSDITNVIARYEAFAF